MALSAAIVFEVRTTGSDSACSGGFKTGASGTDYSQQDAAQYTLTGLTTAAANAIILTSSAAAVMVGNLIQITGGTNFTVGFYEIVSVSVGVSITVDRNCTTAAGASGTGVIGGALATPGLAAATAQVAGQKIYLKSGTYTFTTSTAGAGGPVVLAASQRILLEGYNATRGDLGTPPVISAGSRTSVTIVTLNGTYSSVQVVVNIKADGNSGSGNTGFLGNQIYVDEVYQCQAVNCPSRGFYANLGIVGSIATSCGTGFDYSSAAGFAFGCVAKSCTSIGFKVGPQSKAINCIADSCATGFNGQYGSQFFNCSAYGSTNSGFYQSTYDYGIYLNCLAVSNGAYGFDNLTAPNAQFKNCAGYNNTSGNRHTAGFRLDDVVALTASPFTNAAGGDFSLNSTAGGGAACKAAGFPGVFPGGATTGYLDIGAAQSQGSAGIITNVIAYRTRIRERVSYRNTRRVFLPPVVQYVPITKARVNTVTRRAATKVFFPLPPVVQYVPLVRTRTRVINTNITRASRCIPTTNTLLVPTTRIRTRVNPATLPRVNVAKTLLNQTVLVKHSITVR